MLSSECPSTWLVTVATRTLVLMGLEQSLEDKELLQLVWKTQHYCVNKNSPLML